MELIVGAAFEKTSIVTSTGPDIPIFKRFKEQWPFVDRDNFQTASSVESLVASSCSDILAFARTHLEVEQAQDDYREFLELSIIFLGDVPARGIRFQLPGAMHRARWMANVIYAIKMWLFRRKFKMTASEEREFVILLHFQL